jgi:predicted AAA+ superfamily ATPase
MIIPRTIEPIVASLAATHPVLTITGPRQSGKTTLCRRVFPDKPYVNLEAPDVRRFAQDDPRGFLATYPDGAILDEIQRVPDLLSYIQVIVDEQQRAGQFIITGSQQFEVLNTISQSLAGRTALLKLLPLSIEELVAAEMLSSVDNLLLKGFYPRIHAQELAPTQALGDYLVTYVERDIRQLVNVKDLAHFEKFVRLCAGRIGQLLNLQSLGNDVGISHTTARAWLTLLEASYIVFLLQPWHGNFSKRQIKSPKLYFYDVGLAAFLLGLESEAQVSRDPLKGNLFENMAVVEALKFRLHRGKRSNLYFYRDGKGNEVDLLLAFGRDLFPVEIKSGATIAPDFFKGLKTFARVAGELPWGGGLVYGGAEIQLRSDARVYPVSRMHELLTDISGDE